MIFNSVTFLVFLTVVVVLFWVLPNRVRIWMIFLSSLVFYGFWRWEFLSIVLLSTITDYWVAIKMEGLGEAYQRKRKHLLYISLFVNLGLLFYFKYLFFFTDSFCVSWKCDGTEIK